jgi:hypothetical protein
METPAFARVRGLGYNATLAEAKRDHRMQSATAREVEQLGNELAVSVPVAIIPE